jgi:glyoxylase-like metal-dependent hydrolase (beta-lactamase superfamily II)
VYQVRVSEIGGGVFRVTHPMPWVLNHVHCYAIADPEGWTLVDTGLGDPHATARWREALARLGDPRVARIVVTHHHPDHCGAGAALAELTSPDEIVQGADDARITEATWRHATEDRAEAHLREHGMPAELVERVLAEQRGRTVDPARPTRLVTEGDILELAGETFRVLELPGHADGHIALLGERSGRMLGGDVLLEEITPNIPRWPDSRADPLGLYLATLERIRTIRPAIVYPGHRRPIDDPAGRAAEIREHHAVRLDLTEAALRAGARTGHDVAVYIWGEELATNERLFALLEALSHLEHLERAGRARRDDGTWTPV